MKTEMRNEIETIIQKHNICLTSQQGMVAIRGKKPTSSEITKIKELKTEIIIFLKEENIKEKIQEEIERKKAYEPLMIQLKKREFSSLNDDEKAKEIMATKSTKRFYGEEDEGLNMSIAATNNKIQAEARKYCCHDIKTNYWYTHTGDARLKIERTISCQKCGLYIVDTAEEEISIQTALGM